MSKNNMGGPPESVIYAEDMEDERLARVLNTAVAALGLSDPLQPTTFRIIAEHIRSTLDKTEGPGWNCVAGKSYGELQSPLAATCSHHLSVTNRSQHTNTLRRRHNEQERL